MKWLQEDCALRECNDIHGVVERHGAKIVPGKKVSLFDIIVKKGLTVNQ
jgi:hypothetical protein